MSNVAVPRKGEFTEPWLKEDSTVVGLLDYIRVVRVSCMGESVER